MLDQVLLDNVPFYPQEKYQCGPASLATMLNTQGLATDPDILKELVYLPGRQGSLQVEMVAGARSHDMVVYPLATNIDAVLSEVTAGNPVLVMQNLRFNWWPQWHFAVVVGYDSDKEVLILNTDTRRHYRMPYKTFHATWDRASRWAMVILPPDKLPETAETLPYLRAAHDLEITGHTLAAQKAYETAEHRWPDQPAPIMAQGNLAYDQHKPATAAAHFLRVVNRFPDFPEGWNNLAYALDASASPKQAAEALACAIRLDPERFGQANLQFSDQPSPDSSHCPALPICPEPEVRQ
ncbi:PA2778 family cysteine peptidase [Marinobacter sp.]|uniref:PA2778 family cysteine peptidase n=1 Tax=Marinobacter sp. TaxID=50741 RepID=UPI0025C01065|nr:PA2778 family cysteine peptidase [Marinobacter sp.]